MRGQTAPAPIWEGEDAVVAWLPDGPGAATGAADPGRARRAILDTFTKAHSAEYQAQAFIDLAFRLREGVGDTGRVERVVLRTSDHTHNVIGTGPATREARPGGHPRDPGPLGHVHLRRRPPGRPLAPPGQLHPERAARPDTVRLWHRVETVEDPAWTACYHGLRPGLARLRRPGRGPPGRRRGGRRRAGCGRRPSQRRGPVRPPRLPPQAGHPGRWGWCWGRAGPVRRPGRAPRQLAPDDSAGLTVTADHLRRPPTAGGFLRWASPWPRAPAEKRRPVAGLASGRLLRMPGAFSPLVARLVEELGFDGAYVSGAVVAADLGLPDVGLTTMTEVAQRARQIASATTLPVLADADTGFGEPFNALPRRPSYDLGPAGCCPGGPGQPAAAATLTAKRQPVAETWPSRSRAATAARRDPDPDHRPQRRPGGRGPPGYAGATGPMSTPAPRCCSPRPWPTSASAEAVRRPDALLSNMTEFGRSKLFDARTLADLGVNLVIYPASPGCAWPWGGRGRAAAAARRWHPGRPGRPHADQDAPLRAARLRRLHRLRPGRLRLRRASMRPRLLVLDDFEGRIAGALDMARLRELAEVTGARPAAGRRRPRPPDRGSGCCWPSASGPASTRPCWSGCPSWSWCCRRAATPTTSTSRRRPPGGGVALSRRARWPRRPCPSSPSA